MSKKRKIGEIDSKAQSESKYENNGSKDEWVQTDTKEFVRVNSIIALKLNKANDTNEAKLSFVLEGGLHYAEITTGQQGEKTNFHGNLFHITGNEKVMGLLNVLNNESMKKEYNSLFSE